MRRVLFLQTILLSLLVILFSCKQSKKEQEQNLSTYQEYVTGATTGMIKRADPIIIIIASDMIDPVLKGSKLQNSELVFSPSLQGDAVWATTSSLVFSPKQELDWDIRYTATLKLGKICKVPKELSEMKFSFRTPAKQFVVRQNGLSISEKADGTYQLKGLVQTSDIFENNEVEKAITSKQDKKDLTIVWEHQPKMLQHNFTITGIKRFEENSEVVLTWDGNKIDATESRGTETIKVPSLKDFKVAGARVINTPDQYVEVMFSDPLKADADLRGMVLIDNQNVSQLKVEYNALKIYMSGRLTGEHTLTLFGGIESASGYKLNSEVKQTLNFGGEKPLVRLLGNGVIVPQSEGLYFPFEAVNLSAVDVRITKIFTNNIHSFLQDNNYNGDYRMNRVGRIIKRAKVDLTQKGAKDLSIWNAFNLDLSKLIDVEPGAIYNVEIGFRKAYSLFGCDANEEEEEQFIPVEDEENNPNKQYNTVYYNFYYDWQKRDMPCNQAYFSPDKFVTRNIIGSNFGMIAKTDPNGKTYVYITSLLTAKPESGVKVSFYDYQNQLLGSTSTDGSGMLSLKTERSPFLLVAEKDDQVGYLEVNTSTAISTSNFDVDGKTVEKGIKGFLYAERNVWRPGDSIYLSFILEDKLNNLPQGHPLTLEIYNPKGQYIKKVVRVRNESFIYPFYFKTKPEDPTGNWQVILRAGTIDFSRSIQVETVKPNRLKVELEFGDETLSAQKISNGKLVSKWLHGTPAKNLKAKVDVSFNSYTPTFKEYKAYDFSTPYDKFYSNDVTLFDGKLDEDGKADLKFEFKPNKEVSGFLRAYFTTKVFENGGDFSINHFSKPFSPYANYVGLKIDWSYKGWKKLNCDEDHTIKVATVNAKGEPVNVEGVKVKLFALDYRWWYDSNNENLASYAGQTYHKPVFTATVNTNNGLGEFKIKKDEDRWGRHLLLITSPDGHVSGQVIYFGWSWGRNKQKGGAQVLALVTEKDNFVVGEDVTISFPANKEAPALLTFENGMGINGQEWVENLQDYNHYTFKAKPEMAPNVYVSIMLIQPHAQTANDLPIRLFGVVPIMVEDPATRLNPVLTMPDEVRPLREFTVKISEANKQAMDYTIAIVDEGLLDLTNFKTPAPWGSFYAREALNIRTYDMYNYVMGSFGSRLESMFAVGGSDGMNDGSKKKAERFKPVVKVLGPFHLNAKKEASHKVTLPQYVGSVRAMVIAAENGKYGHTDKTVPVREPLMVLATLPRVLSPEETVDLPVTIFAMDPKVKSVKIHIAPNEMLQVLGSSDTTIVFDKIGEKDIVFKVRSVAKVGIAKMRVEASSSNEKTFHEMELDIRHPNLPTVESEFKMLKSGEKWEVQLSEIGMEGTNSAQLEVSNMPPLNLGSRLQYLIRYPHGCVEQTTSAVFPQLYLPTLMDLTDEQEYRIGNHIENAIEKLQSFRTSDGGFAYWPGNSYSNSWASSYVMYFLLEAEKAGYLVPANMKNDALNYLRKTASGFRDYKYDWSCYSQAFSLYVLSVAGEGQISAMNRLRKEGCLNNQGKWLLAASYANAGMKEVAYELIDMRNMEPDNPYWECYGSILRDRSMMLQTLIALNEMEQATKMTQKISQDLSGNYWHSTQTTAYSLVALANFANKTGAGKTMEFVVNTDGKSTQVNDDKKIRNIDVAINKTGKANIYLENKGSGTLFVTLTNQGVKPGIDAVTEEKGLQLMVKYFDSNWKEVNIESIKQGQDFMAYTTVYNKTGSRVTNVALSQMFPSGWEIINSRLFETSDTRKTSTFDYQDIRDDRVFTYFDLGSYDSKSFLVRLNASYCGEFLLSPITCEAMYDNIYMARLAGRKVKVVKE